MSKKQQPPGPAIRAQLSKIRAVYYGMLIPVVALSAVVYILIENGQMGEPDYSAAPLIQTIAIILVPGCLAAGYFFFKASLSRLDRKLLLNEKLTKYLTLLLIRSAILEIGFFFCFIAAVLTRVSLFLAAAPIFVFIFLLLRPTGQSIALDLGLTGKEKEHVEGQ